MKQRSLRLRLLGLAAIFITLALILAGGAIGVIFVGNVERSVRAELSANLTRLIAAIEPAAPGLVGPSPLPDPRYETPVSGAYWQIEDRDGDGLWRSRSLLDVVLDTSQQGGAEAFGTLAGPGAQPLSALSRDISFRDQSLRVTLAQNRALLDESIRQFGGELLVALVLLGLALIAASALQVWFGLRPLEGVRAAVEAIRHGRLETLPTDYPSEIQPLATEVNELLAAQTSALEFARARAADLAHSLKTPLTVMATLVSRLREHGDQEGAVLLDRLVGEMDDRVAYQLRLSRLRHRTREHQLSVELADSINRAVDVLKRTPAGENIHWNASVAADLRVDIDRQDLQELVGILLENACKWALTTVRVRAGKKEGTVEIEISDDGPGLPEGGLEKLGKRGHRLDESAEGSGLGLSMVYEIVSINNGSINFAKSDEGGLQIRVVLVAGEARP